MIKNVKIKELWHDGFFSIITAFSFAVYNGYLGLAKNYYFGFSVAVYYLLLCSVRGVSYVALKKEKQYPDENFDRYYVVSAVLHAFTRQYFPYRSDDFNGFSKTRGFLRLRSCRRGCYVHAY